MSAKDIDLLTLTYTEIINCTECRLPIVKNPLFKFEQNEIYCLSCFFKTKKCSKCPSDGVVEEEKSKIVYCDQHAWAHFNENRMIPHKSYIDTYEYGNSRYLAKFNKELTQTNIPNIKNQEISKKIIILYTSETPTEFYSDSLVILRDLKENDFRSGELKFSFINALVYTLLKLNLFAEAIEYAQILAINQALKIAILYLNFVPMSVLFTSDKIKPFFKSLVELITEESIEKKRLRIFIILCEDRNPNLIDLFKSFYSSENLKFRDFFYIQQDLSRYILYLNKQSDEEILIVQYHYLFLRKLMPSNFQSYNFYFNAAICMFNRNLHNESRFFSEKAIKTSIELYGETFSHLIKILIILAKSKINLSNINGVPQLLTLAYETIKSLGNPSEFKEDLLDVLNLFSSFYTHTKPEVSYKATVEIQKLNSS